MTGKLWEIIQKHIDASPYPPSERQVAKRLGVSPTALSNWKSPKKLPEASNLQAIARLTGVPYAKVLDAALHDAGYASGKPGPRALASVPATTPGLDYDAVHDALDAGEYDDVPFAAGAVHENDGVEQQGPTTDEDDWGR